MGRVLRSSRVLVLPLVLALAGCGGWAWDWIDDDDDDSSDEAATTRTLDGIPDRDGFVSDFGLVSLAGPFPVYVGDDGIGNDQMRGVLSFAHGSLPAGARIVAATLFVNQVSVGGSPFTSLGPAVFVDHVDFGAMVEAADFDSPALAAAIGDLSTSTELGSRWLDVTDAVQADVDAGRTTTDFRLSFAIGNDFGVGNDFVMFTDAEDTNGTHVPPALVVSYR